MLTQEILSTSHRGPQRKRGRKPKGAWRTNRRAGERAAVACLVTAVAPIETAPPLPFDVARPSLPGCERCGTTTPSPGGRGPTCPDCGALAYPADAEPDHYRELVHAILTRAGRDARREALYNASPGEYAKIERDALEFLEDVERMAFFAELVGADAETVVHALQEQRRPPPVP